MEITPSQQKTTSKEKVIELTHAIKQLSSRGLLYSTKWCAELLDSISENTETGMELENQTVSEDRNNNSRVPLSTKKRDFMSTPFSTPVIQKSQPQHFSIQMDSDDEKELASPKYLLAKCYFDLREYSRAADVLKQANTRICYFLKCYSLYLVNEMSNKRCVFFCFGFDYSFLFAKNNKGR